MDRATVTTEVTVRPATPADSAAVQELVGEIAAHQGQSADVAVDAAGWRVLLGRPDVTVLLAESGGRVIGYVSAVRRLHLWSGRDVVALDDLYVRSDFRDRGVGRLLMLQLAQRAEGMTITWGVQPDNVDAIRFYERLGASTWTKVVCAWTPE